MDRALINKVKQLIEAAGAERLRALFSKYHLKITPNVAGVATGVQLYGQPFAYDFAVLCADALHATANADGTTTGSTPEWVNTANGLVDMVSTLGNSAANIIATLNNKGGTTNGTTSIIQPAPTTGAGTTYLVPQASGSNTGTYIIIAVVAVLVLAAVIFIALRKK